MLEVGKLSREPTFRIDEHHKEEMMFKLGLEKAVNVFQAGKRGEYLTRQHMRKRLKKEKGRDKEANVGKMLWSQEKGTEGASDRCLRCRTSGWCSPRPLLECFPRSAKDGLLVPG